MEHIDDVIVADGGVTHSHQDIGNKKRAPHNNKKNKDNAQYFRCLLFIAEGQRAPQKQLFIIREKAQRQTTIPPGSWHQLVQAKCGFTLEGIYGQEVCYHHDGQWHEEGHKGADKYK